ncbi:MAG: hypothetical protein E7066_06310 [Lentimicrobiaceae bacterium]|nr:hypothetical protein [Lentimicrobiaceae bacterium]
MNNNINRDELKKRLLNEGYIESNGIEMTLDNLLNLTGDAADMLEEWMKTGKVRRFEPIEGFDRVFLRNEMKMKDPAIILAYGMLLDNPKYNAVMLHKMHERQRKYEHKINKELYKTDK